MKVIVTYAVATPESAQMGDLADCGWALPGGWEFSSRDPETVADAAKNCDDYVAYTWEEPGDLGGIIEGLQSEFGLRLEGDELCSVNPPHDRAFFERGETRSYQAHIEGVTPSTLKRLKRFFV